MELYIIGCGGHAKQIIDAFESKNIKITGFFDDSKTGTFRNYKIYGKISDIEKYSDITLFNAIGDNKVRKNICDKYNMYTYINCIHDRAYVSRDVVMGYGNYVGPNATINPDTKIGNFNIFNYNSCIGHDTIIGDYNHFAPSSCLTGWISIGNNNFICANSTIIPKIIMKDNIVLGAGSTLIKDVEIEGTYVGSPAKLILKQ